MIQYLQKHLCERLISFILSWIADTLSHKKPKSAVLFWFSHIRSWRRLSRKKKKRWERLITNTNNLARAKLWRNILTESPLSTGRSKTSHSLTGEKKIASSLNSQNPFNFQTRRIAKEIFLFPVCPPSHIQLAINNQINHSFRPCCCSHTRTYHSGDAFLGLQVHKQKNEQTDSAKIKGGMNSCSPTWTSPT